MTADAPGPPPSPTSPTSPTPPAPPAPPGARLDPRGAGSVAVATALVAVGAWRYASDLWCDANPEYWRRFEGTPVRYLIRAPSDGTLLGDLNVQAFKVLSIPCALALVYLWFRRRFTTLAEGGRHFGTPWVRVLWIATFFVAFTLIEVEKEHQLLGRALGTRTAPQLAGETFWRNNLAHLLSAGLAWALCARLSFAPVIARPTPPRPRLPGRRGAAPPPPAGPPPPSAGDAPPPGPPDA